MTRIFKDDVLYYSNKTNVSSYISESSRRLSTSINTFVEGSKEKLVGKQFDLIREHLVTYSEAYRRLSELGMLLTNSIKSTNNKMLNYMNNYSSIDNSQINEIERRIVSIESLVSSLDLKNKSTKESEYYSRILEVLKQRKEKLLELEPLDRELFESFVGAMTDIRTFKKSVSEIKTIGSEFK